MKLKAPLAAVLVAIVLIAIGTFAYRSRAAAARTGAPPAVAQPQHPSPLPASVPAAPAQAASAQPTLSSQAVASIFPTAPAPCPDDPNDLAGIEGYAPGAGGAEKTGQSAIGAMGGFGGALGGGSTPAPPSGGACRGITPDVQAYFDTVRDRADLIPKDGYDPAVRAQELASANAIFAFVRDRIRTEAYAGAMRGPSGTLQSRGGSPIDKAYLLAAMLQTIGVQARLVHAPLSDAELQQIAGVIRTSDLPSPATSPQLASALHQAHVDASVRQRARDNAARADAMADQGIAAAQTPTGQLAQTLSAHQLALASSDDAIIGAWRTNLRDHWWVQVQQNDGWIDWDPTLPNAQAGSHLGAAPQGDGVGEPPADQKTAVAIRITADYTGGSSGKTLVEAHSTTDALYGVPVTITVGDRSRGSNDLKDARSFTPSIAIGDNETKGDEFALDPGGGPRVAALHVQIETSVPGGKQSLATRTFLDRRTTGGGIDTQWTPERSAYAATTSFSLLVVAGEVDAGFAARREAEGLRAVRAFIAYVTAGGYGKQMPPAGIAATYPVEGLHYLEQDAIARRRLEASAKARFFVDRPQIVMMRRSLALDGRAVVGAEQFDIVDNGMTAVGGDAAAAIRANFTRGYIDTVIEQHLLAAGGDGGTIGLFAAAARAGIAPAVSTDAKYGGTAIVPSAPVALGGRPRLGWWQVDRATGNLVGRMDDGAGQELVEYAMARANDWSTLYAMIQFYGDFFRCIAGAVEGPLAGREAGSDAAQNWFKQCAGAALCSYLEALTMSEAFSRMDNDLLALIYNILDLSITGTKNSWPPSLGAACSGMFNSPFGTPGSTG